MEKQETAGFLSWEQMADLIYTRDAGAFCRTNGAWLDLDWMQPDEILDYIVENAPLLTFARVYKC